MSDEDEPCFGEEMAAARNARGMTQEALSKALGGKGYSVSAIQKWEAGKLPSAGKQARIRVALGMQTTEAATRASWPDRVRDIQETVCDLLATMPPEEQRRWRKALMTRVMQKQRTPSLVPWSDDVDMIADIIGGHLVQED